MKKYFFMALLLIGSNLVSLQAEPADSLSNGRLGAVGADSLRNVMLQDVTVTSAVIRKTSLPAQTDVIVSSDEMHRHIGHSLMDALSHTEGVQAMNIGVGFSKPMIRGLGFQRVAVTEDGLKQEGQQWGVDHGLEIDAFHVGEVRIIKGPASVIYGSDALGGVIEVLPAVIPRHDTVSGEVLFNYQSVCNGMSGSAMVLIKRNHFFAEARYTERHWADYRVPTDSFTYLSRRLPIVGRRLKNTAGFERNGNLILNYQQGMYQGRLHVSDNYQKAGFFSGAHGIPDGTQLQEDGNHWNIDLPYSLVNHLKLTFSNHWTCDVLQTQFVLGYQANHREEWSRFHTHNPGQMPPEEYPDRELLFHLQTGSAELRFRLTPSTTWEHQMGISAVVQHNRIDGYGFLIPAYLRAGGGACYLVNCRPLKSLLINASARYDMAYIHSREHGDDVSELKRFFHDYSLAFGAEYTPAHGHLLRVAVGRAFRLPSVNELTSNGVHHGAFRHERGDSSLVSEQGWQMDVSYNFKHPRCQLTISPFYSYYMHFISLHPTGQWSPLPDAGQVYQYKDAPTTRAGAEINLKVQVYSGLHYTFSGEYVYTYDHICHTATPFSPPATMRNTLSWEADRWQCFVECQSVAAQHRVCHNEEPTPGYNLVHIGGDVTFPFRRSQLHLLLLVQNLLNTSYLNHLNFYRQIDLPEAGINAKVTVLFSF